MTTVGEEPTVLYGRNGPASDGLRLFFEGLIGVGKYKMEGKEPLN